MKTTTQELAAQYGVDLDDLAEWCGLHYRRDFSGESPAKKREWILRFAESHGLLSSVDKVAEVGELLIRAAAALGTLQPQQQEENKELILMVTYALSLAAKGNNSVSKSLLTHPPQGLVRELSHPLSELLAC